MYRLYVDESGDHTYKQLQLAERRYLALVGCFFELYKYQQEFQPKLEGLKANHFPQIDPDEPVILHRDDIVNKRGPFRVLLDPAVETAFNSHLLSFVAESNFKVIAVVIDKQAHIERYGDAAWHPYHYCLTAMLERYCGYLNFINKRGDVLGESRGKTEDSQLKQAYQHTYNSGTNFHSPDWFRKALTSHEIKLKPKLKNIAGLQLADLLAHPVKRSILAEKGIITAPEGTFGEQMCAHLTQKYNRQVYTGEIWGYGKIFLP